MNNKSSLMIAVSAFALIGVITLALFLSGCKNNDIVPVKSEKTNKVYELSAAEDTKPEETKETTVVFESEEAEDTTNAETGKEAEVSETTKEAVEKASKKVEVKSGAEIDNGQTVTDKAVPKTEKKADTAAPAVTTSAATQPAQTQQTVVTPIEPRPTPQTPVTPETVVSETTTVVETSPPETEVPETTTYETTASPTPERDEPRAADFTVYDENGNAVRLSDYLGKPIVLNFWASWCGPCMREMPHFNEKYLELSGDVVFLMVNVTNYDTVSAAKAVINENGYSFPILFDTYGEANETYGVTGFPTTYFIDAEGYLMAYARGSISAETLQEQIDLIS